MKKVLLIVLVALLLPQAAWARGGKHGALAVDSSRGFIYGFSYDYSTQQGANQRALWECRKRGGRNCRLVLVIQGRYRCGAYRMSADGRAWGWARANDRRTANNLAYRQCRRHSRGVACNRYAWACNSSSGSVRPQPHPLPQALPPLSRLRWSIQHFYNNNSVMAGKFRMVRITRFRYVRSGSIVRAHVRYRYVPRAGYRASAGYDQRVFTARIVRGGYRVLGMGGYNSARFASSAPRPRPQPQALPPFSRLRGAIHYYYNNRGEWAGKFRMVQITRFRVVRTGRDFVRAHVRYRYAPVAGYSRRGGYDQRVFTARIVGGTYRIVRMGPYNSARF